MLTGWNWAEDLSTAEAVFICTGDATFLDGQYTCFGQLVEGDDVLEKIAKTPVGRSSMGEMSRPLKRVEVKSIRSKQ